MPWKSDGLFRDQNFNDLYCKKFEIEIGPAISSQSSTTLHHYVELSPWHPNALQQKKSINVNFKLSLVFDL
jgi:hypothetical protein